MTDDDVNALIDKLEAAHNESWICYLEGAALEMLLARFYSELPLKYGVITPLFIRTLVQDHGIATPLEANRLLPRILTFALKRGIIEKRFDIDFTADEYRRRK